MLTTSISANTLLIGLAGLINRPKDGFAGHYRVLQVGGNNVIEFFEGAATKPGMLPVQILPYAPGKINTTAVGGAEVISGEFTGCVMSLFSEGGMLKCAHVDTNPDTTQRDAYDTLKTAGGINLVDEYDSTGKLGAYPALTGDTRLLCVASGNTIVHYFVNRELHQYSGNVPTPGGGPTVFGKKSETRYKVLQSLGH